MARDQRALLEIEVSEWTDEELAIGIRGSYGPVEVPPCRLCGGPLSCQSVGGGPTKYACTALLDDRGVERAAAWEHYGASAWEDCRQGGDERVIELLRRHEAAR